MFDNISKLRFVQGPAGEPIANAMISSEGEIMEYRQGVPAEGKVYLHVHSQHHTSIRIHTFTYTYIPKLLIGLTIYDIYMYIYIYRIVCFSL